MCWAGSTSSLAFWEFVHASFHFVWMLMIKFISCESWLYFINYMYEIYLLQFNLRNFEGRQPDNGWEKLLLLILITLSVFIGVISGRFVFGIKRVSLEKFKYIYLKL